MRYLIFCILTVTTLLGANMKTIYDFKVTNIDGQIVKMSEYKDKVLLIVNVASKCGFTSQYEGLEKLYDKYKKEDFVILGFPSNQFMNQEPGSNKEIKQFCSLTYGVSFPMFEKIDVNGENAHPLYSFLKEKASGVLGIDMIKWNFTKFLVDKKGNVVQRFAPATKPSEIEEDIKSLL